MTDITYTPAQQLLLRLGVHDMMLSAHVRDTSQLGTEPTNRRDMSRRQHYLRLRSRGFCEVPRAHRRARDGELIRRRVP